MTDASNATNRNNTDEVRELADEVDQVVSHAARTVELGRRGFTIAVAVFALIIGHLLPWVGDQVGWRVMLGNGGAVPQLFAVTSVVIGVLASIVTLMTRRWWLTWVCAIGGWFASVDGVLAIWSQQSTHTSGVPGAGPGIGLIIALVAMIVLAANWFRAAWSRT